MESDFLHPWWWSACWCRWVQCAQTPTAPPAGVSASWTSSGSDRKQNDTRMFSKRVSASVSFYTAGCEELNVAYWMRVHDICPVFLQRGSLSFLAPPPLQTDWHRVGLQFLFQHVQLSPLLMGDRGRQEQQRRRKGKQIVKWSVNLQ